MQCVELTSACLRIHAPTPACSSQCARCAFTIELHGANASAQRIRAARALHMVHDPLNHFRLRHVERCMRVGARPPERHDGAIPTMLWVTWEKGYADQLLRSVLPVAHAMRSEPLSEPLMISGTLFPHLWTAFGMQVCTVERTTPNLSRCTPACYERMRMCRTLDVFGRAAYRAHSFYVHKAYPGIPVARRGVSAQHGFLRVLFARRAPVNPQHTRSLLNVRELVDFCNTMEHVQNWRVSCSSAYLAKLTTREAIALVRGSDVLVCMNGGDCAHGMHLPRGRTVVETVPHGFETAPDPWLNLYRSRMIPSLQHRRIVLCENRTKIRSYTDAWNVPGVLPPARFRAVLRSIVQNVSRPLFACDEE